MNVYRLCLGALKNGENKNRHATCALLKLIWWFTLELETKVQLER